MVVAKKRNLKVYGKRLLMLSLFLASTVVSGVSGKNYYISAKGSDSNSGTIDKPFASIYKYGTVAEAGDTGFVRGGTIMRENKDLNITANGTKENPICLFAYPGEKPVINGTLVVDRANEGLLRFRQCSWWHVKGIEVTKANVDWTAGLTITDCSNMVVENCSFYENRFTGLEITGSSSDILILNCDSYMNWDPPDYGDADGFQVYPPTKQKRIIFRGCRAWNNSDDGWDLYFAASGSVLIENCWSFHNGYDKNGNPLGDGNGFKLGGNLANSAVSSTGGHKVIGCMSWGNKHCGYNENNSEGADGDTLYNNTAYNNHNYADFDFDVPGPTAHVLRNNISFKHSNNRPFASKGDNEDSKNNSWDLNTAISESDFVSLDDTGLDGPRNSDHSLPFTDFLRPSPTGIFIDKGEDIGLAFNGSAPDLGAIETGGGTAVISTPLNHTMRAKYNSFSNRSPQYFMLNGRSLPKTANSMLKNGINLSTGSYIIKK